jgi:hypothetical protein
MSSTLAIPQPRIEIDPQRFQEEFPFQGFKVRHQLAGCPLFELSRLVELAQRLPADEIEYFTGKVDVNQDPKSHPKNGLSVAETVRRIEECGSWMVLKNVQHDEEYGRLMREVLDSVYQHAGLGKPHREEAFIFISSPGSVTPFHLDEEHNFLCQIRGSKEVNMWDPRNRQVVPEPLIEHMLQIWHGQDYHRNMPYRDEFQKAATVHRLEPGDALHFPVGAPHWVKNGPEVSVSFSVTFRSAWSERQAILYFVNSKLRRLGLDPVPPGKSAWRDSLKYRLFQAGRQVSHFAGGSWLRRNQSKWA